MSGLAERVLLLSLVALVLQAQYQPFSPDMRFGVSDMDWTTGKRRPVQEVGLGLGLRGELVLAMNLRVNGQRVAYTVLSQDNGCLKVRFAEPLPPNAVISLRAIRVAFQSTPHIAGRTAA